MVASVKTRSSILVFLQFVTHMMKNMALSLWQLTKKVYDNVGLRIRESRVDGSDNQENLGKPGECRRKEGRPKTAKGKMERDNKR